MQGVPIAYTELKAGSSAPSARYERRSGIDLNTEMPARAVIWPECLQHNIQVALTTQQRATENPADPNRNLSTLAARWPGRNLNLRYLEATRVCPPNRLISHVGIQVDLARLPDGIPVQPTAQSQSTSDPGMSAAISSSTT
jgi:hypothetical protein